MKLSPRMTRRFLRGHGSQLTLTILAIALGVALVCAIDLINRAVLRAFVEVIDTMAGRAALQISGGQSGLFPEDMAQTVASVPGVELAVPVVQGAAFTTDETAELLTVQGIDVTNESSVRIYDARTDGGLEIEDPLVFLSQPDSVVLTRNFALRRNLTVGDRIELLAPTGRRQFTVRGLLEPRGVARVFGGNLVVMDLLAAEAAFARPGFINRIDVVVERGADPDAVGALIRALLPPGLRVDTPAQRKLDLHRVMQSFQIMMRAVGLVGLLTAVLISFNRIATVYQVRTWQLGVMRAVGLRTRTVCWELVKESAVLGLFGVAMGIPLGIGLGRLFLPVVAQTSALAFSLIAPDAELSVRPESLLLAVAVGLGSAVAAAILPAWRTARIAVAEVIRSRGIEAEVPMRRKAWLSIVALVAVAVTVEVQSLTGAPEWGFGATGCIVLVSVLAARPVLLRAVLPLLRALNEPTVRFVAESLRHNPARAALICATLGIGLGAVLWLSVVGSSFEKSVTDKLQTVMQADLIVTSAHVASGLVEAPVDEGVIPMIRSLRGVTSVVGERVAEWHYAGGPIAIDTFDPLYFAAQDFGELGGEDARAADAVARGAAVIVSGNLVSNIGGKVGDSILLDTPSGPLSLRIAGVTTHFLSPRGTIEISRELYRKHWQDPQVTHILVHTTPGADVAAIRGAIIDTLGGRYGLRVLLPAEVSQFFAGQVRRCFAAFDILAGMMFLVVLVGVADTLMVGVLERTGQLGMMRCVGLRQQYVRRTVVLEACTIGGVGVAIGLATGAALGALWVEATFPHLLGWVLHLHLPVMRTAFLSAVTFVVCVAASLAPARHAARLDPAVALRSE